MDKLTDEVSLIVKAEVFMGYSVCGDQVGESLERWRQMVGGEDE